MITNFDKDAVIFAKRHAEAASSALCNRLLRRARVAVEFHSKQDGKKSAAPS